MQNFFNNVIVYLGYYGWKLNIIKNSKEGFCWHHKKTIDVGENNSNPKRLILHEISHIDTCRFCNNKHSIFFWKKYEDLMRKFLPLIELETRYFENSGIYKLCYKRTNLTIVVGGKR